MPTVPQYGVQQVESQGFSGLANPSAPAGAFGEGIGAAISQTADRYADNVQRIKREDDDVAVKQAVLEFREGISALGQGDEGFYGLQGKDAGYKARDGYLKKIDELRNTIGERMTPGRQQALFAELGGEYQFREQDNSAKHTAVERQRHMTNLRTAERMQAQQDAALYWGDNEAYLAQIRRSIANQGKADGWEQEQIDFETQAALTSTHAGAVSAILAQDNPAGATAYLAQHADEIHGQSLAELQDKVRDHGELKTAMAVADPLRNSGMLLGERMAAVRANKSLSPEERKAAEQRVQSDYSLEKAEKQDAQDEVLTNMWQALIDNPGSTAQDLRRIYPNEWESLDASGRLALESGLDAKRRTDPLIALEVEGMLADPTKSSSDVIGFLRENYTSFSTGDLISVASNARKPEAIRNVETDSAAFTSMVGGFLGKKPTGKTSLQNYERKEAMLRGMYQRELRAWEEANPGKKNIPAEERQKILDNIEWQYSKPNEIYQFGPEQQIGLDDIEVDVLERLEAELADAGLPVTTQNLVALYMDENG